MHVKDLEVVQGVPASKGCRWALALLVGVACCRGLAADQTKATISAGGGITVYNEKGTVVGTDLKTGPVTTTKDTPPAKAPEETVTTITRMGNVTELKGDRGTKSTVVTVGPVTEGKVNGKGISVTRVGENVAVGSDERGGSMKALQVGNQVVVEKSGTVSPSAVRIAVQALLDPLVAKGTGHSAAATNGLEVQPFTGIEVSGDLPVEVTCGRPFDILIADKETQEYTDFDVEDGVLRIECLGRRPGGREFGKIVVSLPALTAVTALEGARVTVRNVAGPRCTVACQGGRVDVAGVSDDAVYRVSGGGVLQGKDLRAGRISVRVDGEGEVHCLAERELVVRISGKGTVWSHSHPGLVTRKILGGGELKFAK